MRLAPKNLLFLARTFITRSWELGEYFGRSTANTKHEVEIYSAQCYGYRTM